MMGAGILKQLKTPKRTLITVSALALMAIMLTVALVYFKHYNSPADLNNVAVVERLVGKHFLLPDNEVPALATVTDSSKITTKFLQKAKDGDKILIYQKNGRVIIYRPSIDRIVDVGPVQIGQLKQ